MTRFLSSLADFSVRTSTSFFFSSLFRDKDNKFSLFFALSCINCRTHLFTDSFATLVRFRDSEGGRCEIIEEVYECRLNADKTRLQQDPPGNPAEPVNTATRAHILTAVCG